MILKAWYMSHTMQNFVNVSMNKTRRKFPALHSTRGYKAAKIHTVDRAGKRSVKLVGMGIRNCKYQLQLKCGHNFKHQKTCHWEDEVCPRIS